jgi:predicted NUDIX family NTP pyrophosphohydrolase
MPKLSAGILLFRKGAAGVEVMLVHPGGPFWAKKDFGAWSIPKGLADEAEHLLAAAKREFLEETGMAVDGEFLDLGAHKQPSGKTIVAFACEGDFDPAALISNMFTMEWPPGSGKTAEFPEVDKAAWLPIDEATGKINKGQAPIIMRLSEMNEILTRIAGWSSGPAQAMAWYRAEPIPAFGGRTAEALVKSGQAGPLRDYLDSLALGGLA